MAAVTLSFKTTFNLDTNQFTFVDLTDYTSFGVPPASNDLKGCFKIVTPDGLTYYNNTTFTIAGCDINISDPPAVYVPNSQQTIALPLVSSQVQQGTYLITYTVERTGLADETYIATQTYSYTFEEPEVAIQQTVDCISPLFTSTDATSYNFAGVTPTIVRTHKIIYPVVNGVTPSPITGAATTITTSTFYNGTQTTTISSVLTYNISSTYVIVTTIAGQKEVVVNCQYICTVNCCMRELESRKEAARDINQVLFEKYDAQLTEAMTLYGLVLSSISCGQHSDVSGYIQKIFDVTECTADCDCGVTNSLVVGLGGSGQTFVVNSCSSAIGVTSVTVGSTTTYTVCFDATLLAKLNGLYQAVVAAGTGISVADSGIVSGVRTFTVTNTATPPAALNFQELKCAIAYTNFSSPTISITPAAYLKSGANLGVNSATITSVGFGSDANWRYLNNRFQVSGFQVSGNTNYKPVVQIRWDSGVVITSQQNPAVNNSEIEPKRFDVEVYSQSNDSFLFKIVNQNGMTVTNGALVENNFTIIIKISE